MLPVSSSKTSCNPKLWWGCSAHKAEPPPGATETTAGPWWMRGCGSLCLCWMWCQHGVRKDNCCLPCQCKFYPSGRWVLSQTCQLLLLNRMARKRLGSSFHHVETSLGNHAKYPNIQNKTAKQQNRLLLRGPTVPSVSEGSPSTLQRCAGMGCRVRATLQLRLIPWGFITW